MWDEDKTDGRHTPKARGDHSAAEVDVCVAYMKCLPQCTSAEDMRTPPEDFDMIFCCVRIVW